MSEVRLDQNNKLLYSKLIKVALPIAMQGLIGSSLNLIDNLMVGSLGETELAAVGVSVQIYFVFWMIIFGFSSGCSTFVAQFWGANDMKQIKKTLGFNMTICLTIGLLFFLFSVFSPESIIKIFTDIPEIVEEGAKYVRVGAPCYIFLAIVIAFETALRSTQQAQIPLFISIVAFLSNTLFNYIFIFGKMGAPALGVTGAALATTIARLIQITIILIVVFGGKNIIAGNFKSYFGWNKGFVGKIFKNSIPTTINETLWGVGMAMCVAAFARIGVTEYAALQASNTIQNILQLAAFSIGDALLILVGQKLGEGKKEEAYGLAKKLLKIGAVIGTLCGGILLLIRVPIISLFDFTEKGQGYALTILIIYSIFMCISVLNGMLVVGVLRSGGDTRFAMVCEVGTIWFIAVPLAFFGALVWQLPIYIAVLLIKIEEVIKFIILFRRFLSKKWVKTLTH